MLNILYIVKGNTNYCNYYNDMIYYLKKENSIDTKIYKKYISLLIENKKYDKIIIGFDITNCGDDYPPEIINDTNIPLYIILNKEYAVLDKKLEWIKKLKPSCCFSVHHDVDIFEKKIGVPFYRISWSANKELFKYYQQEYKNYIFF